ncbi:serine hydrolase domain-containing protein [Mucilaginibacter angelicae]|uniref:Serine hydrolase domain-containing protein n=1 Tax=Mucilaginibacter angelicae TaxID=869718 RepID=A0ABV6KYK1_9SPHI
MLKARLFGLFFALILTSRTKLWAQALPGPVVKKINSLFYNWDKTQSPGCAVGVVRNDSLIFSKGYGMANLEYAISNSPQTVYHLASVSKQFTAYAIILLAQQGKLNLDDDIRKYLSWFPNLKQKITIRNLLNHTSGIRDQWQLLGISGTRIDDVITQEHIIKVLSKQQALNFIPGEKFMYSNSGYTLLAEIVKSVSGQSLRKFTDSAIFKPLKMTQTHFHDDYTEIEGNRAYSYDRKDGTRFSNSILSYSTVGATSLLSNIPDLAKWVMNFYDTKIGNQQAILQLTQKAKLNDGTELGYASGILSEKYKGWKQFSHNGADAGFRTSVIVFPELKTGIIVLSNLSEINAQEKASQIADMIISERTGLVRPAEEKTRNVKIPATELLFLKAQSGSYFSDEMNTVTSLRLKNDSLYLRIGTNDNLMARESEHTYSMFYVPQIKLIFDKKGDSPNVSLNISNDTLHFTRIPNQLKADDKSMLEYTGTYNNTELECTYKIILKDHQLYLTNSKYNDERLTLFGSDHLINDTWYMKHLVVTRNKSNKVTGFEVNSWRVMHLKFVKIKTDN